MIEISLSQGYTAIIDNVDYDCISPFVWYAMVQKYKNNKWIYARSNNNGDPILMHRLILNTPKGMHSDHINGNGLDNRRENIRICTRGQNMRNKKKKYGASSSQYKGVSYRKNRSKPWDAEIIDHGRRYWIGSFRTEKEAGEAYNDAAVKLHGEFAGLNLESGF